MNAPTRSIIVTVLLVGFFCLAFVAWFAALLFVVPSFKQRFLGLNERLPFITEVTIAMSRWSLKYWYVAVIVLFGAFATAGAISYVVRHWVPSGLWSVLWFGLLFGLALMAHLFLWVSLFLP